MESMLESANLPMDGFSVCARAVVELGQQSENALSFLNRKTAANSVDKRTLRGTAWPRDEAKRGAICQIVVRDTGFRRGEVLWRSVGLLVDGIGDNARDLRVVSTRAAFSDEFAAQYASCLFYKADGTKLVWECRTDAVKFFFPPADFDPSPAPAMLSCTTLDTTPVRLSRILSPARSDVRQKPADGSTNVAAPKTSAAPERGEIHGSKRKQGVSGQGGDSSSRQKGLGAVGERQLGDERDGIENGVAVVGGESRGRRGRQPGSGGGGGGGGGGGERHSKNDKGATGMDLLRPYVIDLKEEILHLGETIYLFQPPEEPGGSWEELEAVTWAIEQIPDGQVSVKYRVDPRGDRDMAEGCPLLKKIGGRKLVPVGLHLGRFTEKEWTHHGLLLLPGLKQIGDWLDRERVNQERIEEGRIDEVKLSYRKMMQERTKAHLSDVVKASSGGIGNPSAEGCASPVASSSKLVKLSVEEGEALAEACEDRGVQAVLAIVLSPGEAEVVRRPGLKALARLASDSHQKLLEIGRAGGIKATIALLRELGECRDVQENACWLLALLSQVAEFSRRIGSEGGCEQVCKVLKTCSEFGGACPRIQSWALGCLANLLVCRENRRRLLGPGLESEGGAARGRKEEAARKTTTPGEERGNSNQGEEQKQRPEDKHRRHQEEEEDAKTSRQRWTEEGELEEPRREEAAAAAAEASGDGDCTDSNAVGLAGWIHTVLANSDRVAGDRDAQYSGIACVRELAAAGPVPARAMRSTGVPGLVGAALERFGGADPQLCDQANTALRWLSRGG